MGSGARPQMEAGRPFQAAITQSECAQLVRKEGRSPPNYAGNSRERLDGFWQGHDSGTETNRVEYATRLLKSFLQTQNSGLYEFNFKQIGFSQALAILL